MQFSQLNEDTVIVRWPSLQTPYQITHLAAALRQKLGTRIIDLVPSYHSLLVQF